MTKKPKEPIESESLKTTTSADLLQEKVNQLEEIISQKEEDLLRSIADKQNMRQRHHREMEQARSFAISQLIQNLIPALDSFDSALASFEQDDDPHKEGVIMIKNQFLSILVQNNVRIIEPQPKDNYNPHEHEAIQMAEKKDFDHQSIIECVQVGYAIKDRILRPARVIVAK